MGEEEGEAEVEVEAEVGVEVEVKVEVDAEPSDGVGTAITSVSLSHSHLIGERGFLTGSGDTPRVAPQRNMHFFSSPVRATSGGTRGGGDWRAEMGRGQGEKEWSSYTSLDRLAWLRSAPSQSCLLCMSLCPICGSARHGPAATSACASPHAYCVRLVVSRPLCLRYAYVLGL